MIVQVEFKFAIGDAWQHDSNAGLGRHVIRDGVRYGNSGLDLIKIGAGWEF